MPNKHQAPTKFRPPSLSIVTVTPELQKSLQDLQNSSNLIFPYEDELVESELSRRQVNPNPNPDLSLQQNNDKLRQIVYGRKFRDEESEGEDEDDLYHLKPNFEQNLPRVTPSPNRYPTGNNLQPDLLLSPNGFFMNHEPNQHAQMFQANTQFQPSHNQMYNGSNFQPMLDTSVAVKYLTPSQLSPVTSVSESSTTSPVQRKPSSILKQSSSKDDTVEDSNSIGMCSIGASSDNYQQVQEHNRSMNRIMSTRLVKLLSVMYGIVVVVVGAMITIGDMTQPINDLDHLYSIVITAIGFAFLGFIHFDVQRHKSFVMKWQEKRKELIESPLKASGADCDSVSVTTAIIFNRAWNIDNAEIDEKTKLSLNAYRFLTGKHSGSFYLKIGMTLFCMGSIVHQGISFALQIHYFTNDVQNCKNWISFVVYLLRCISAFYQLYMAFKYSNLIINRHHYIVRFGLMHLVGSALSFWFSTIIEEAMDGYMSKVKSNNTDVLFNKTIHHHMMCANETLSNFESIDAIPLLYPFSIEFNIILASVWYIIWTNVENNDPLSQMHHIREEINEDRHTGAIDITYRSNISISADCHASNLGLFGGFLSLLITVTTIIIFFTTIKHSEYKTIGIAIYTAQFGFLTVCSMVAVPLAFWHTCRLNVVKEHHMDNAATAMDDLLLVVPLPFYYIHHILCIYSELNYASVNSVFMAIIYILHLVQVTWQTPFIIDGLRRCANDRKLRFKKPGKELITFAIIINVTLWILITFEIKSVDKYHSMPDYFGKFVWMIILDTCLPLMLFYRFHSSVCLSDIWNHAYEKDH